MIRSHPMTVLAGRSGHRTPLPLHGAPPDQLAATGQRHGRRISVWAELPFADVRAAATDLVRAGVRLKLRTGGTVAADFAGEPALADALAVTVGAGLPFRCTAGLHQAVRHRDPATGFEHHGFLNIALAVHELHRGATPPAASTVLAETDEDAVASAVRRLTPEDTAGLRALFRYFGTCSVQEPLTEMQRIGLLDLQARG